MAATAQDDGFSEVVGPMFRGLPISVSAALMVSFWIGSLVGMLTVQDKRLTIGRWKLRVPVERRPPDDAARPAPWMKIGPVPRVYAWITEQIRAAEVNERASPH